MMEHGISAAWYDPRPEVPDPQMAQALGTNGDQPRQLKAPPASAQILCLNLNPGTHGDATIIYSRTQHALLINPES